MTKLLAQTPELLGAYTSGFDSEAMDAFVANPGAFAALAGIGDDVEVQTVENTDSTFNVTLPFYSRLEKRAGVELSDDDLDAASGGSSALTADEIEIYNMGRDAVTYGRSVGDMEAVSLGTTAMKLVAFKGTTEQAWGQAAWDEARNMKSDMLK